MRDKSAGEGIKEALKKAWNFIWKDDSVWSWIINVLLAFVLIKFIVYPGLGIIFSTGYPVVAVVSGSMEHDTQFDNWWESEATCSPREPCTQGQWYLNKGIKKEQFRNFPFSDGFNTGDIMVLYGTEPEKLKVGDIIVFKSSSPDPIIHRLITIKNSTVNSHKNPYTFSTKGDHNWLSFPFEESISERSYIGKAILRIPYLGWVKIGFTNLVSLIRG